MTEPGGVNLWLCRRFSVVTDLRGTLARLAGIGALALGMWTAPLHAGTFAEFEARCLTPMLEVRESVVDGLKRVPHRAGWESWVPESGNWELRRALPEDVVQYCAIHGAIDADAEAWTEAALASGDWVAVDREPQTLQSTYQREPVIEVEIDHTAPSLTVVETNLES